MKARLDNPLSLFAGLALIAAAPAGSPEDVVARFYAAAQSYSAESGGVPDEETRAKLSPFLTPALAKGLADADAAERRYAERTKHEVPPLLEGDLFSSLFEGPTSVGPAACKADGALMRCAVAMTYKDAGDKTETSWTDEVILANSGGSWLVDDIVYGGTWAFSHTGRLSAVLADAIREADRPPD